MKTKTKPAAARHAVKTARGGGAWNHPMMGKLCVVRTFSAGVHIGRVDFIDPACWTHCVLSGALRLWEWTGGGLSLSGVAANGIKKGRLERTGTVALTGAIEYIPTNTKAWATYEKFVEE